MTPAERSIRMRVNLQILTPADRGYQDWADKRELLRLLDEARSADSAALLAAVPDDPYVTVGDVPDECYSCARPRSLPHSPACAWEAVRRTSEPVR